MDDQPEDRFMTAREVADYVRRTPDTVRRWAKRGLLRSAGRLPDGGWLFRMEDVESLLRQGSKRASKRTFTKEEKRVLAARVREVHEQLLREGR